MKSLLRWLRRAAVAAIALTVLGGSAVIGSYFYIEPSLPSIEKLKDVQLQVPLRVYTQDGRLIAEFGEMRRTPLRYQQFPAAMVSAVLAAEDDRFFEHPGVDYQGLLRAVYYLATTGEKGQGGSTITMQVARNFFLSSEKTYLRKLREIFLALKIERELTKEEILELYLNKIYLGQRAYGVAAAAQVYYGKPLSALEIPQLAMIAGLPKAPSSYNPVINPERARVRRNYVLRRMHELGFITKDEFRTYLAAPATASLHSSPIEVEAPYIAEMVRAEIYSRYGDEAYTAGYRVYTTVDGRLQAAANSALRQGLLEYGRRHGYRGPEDHVEIAEAGEAELVAALAGRGRIGGLIPAIVTAVAERSATVFVAPEQTVELAWEALSWARRYQSEDHVGPEPQTAGEVVAVGDIIRLQQHGDGFLLAEVPAVAGALVSLHPDDGAVLALSGGFDFYQSKFNRVTQAERQPGSNFKPFVYSAALEHGFTTASIINDAPVVFEDAKLEAEWRPENYSGRFYGPTRLREALIRSRNLVSIRLLRAMGIGPAIRHITHFGFDPQRLSRDLSLALGSSALTPLEIVRGYAVLANGGFLVEPYFITRVEAGNGDILFEADPAVACLPCETAGEAPPPPTAGEGPAPVPTDSETESSAQEPRLAPRTVDARNVYLVTSMLRDVVRQGTGRRALSLGRNDLAGKTGTTNDQRDAWFSGFNRDVVATAWVGFDAPRSLGSAEAGARAALPIWIDYMQVALEGIPEHGLEQPPGLASVRIDPETGLLARPGDATAIFETFRSENVPEQGAVPVAGAGGGVETPGAGLTEQLF